MQIYAGSIIAQKRKETFVDNVLVIDVNYICTVVILPAESIEEAEGKMLSIARSRYLVSEGYHTHQAKVLQVSHELAMEYANQFTFHS